MTTAIPALQGGLPGEAEAIEAIARMLREAVERDYPTGTLVRRDAHPKHHGLVRAEFAVDSAVPRELRHGLFAEPRVFPAWIRFSNGAPEVQDDHKRDVRGMAIKLVGVPGQKLLEDERDAPTHDFLLASAARFFVRNAIDYVAFSRAATRKPAIRLLGFYFGWNPLAWRLHELGALVSSFHRARHVLALRYWSQVPSRLGPHAVKYSARPLTTAPALPDNRSPNFLREAMAAHLAGQPASFEFLVQRQRDPVSMPIEDPTIEWREEESPFERVATITIPVQRFEAPEQMMLAEQLSFTPWHALPAHEPIGGINRVRRTVYQAISQYRHARNGVPRQEPSSLEIDPALVSARPS
jgi:Catalase